jgi:hypothetical protein
MTAGGFVGSAYLWDSGEGDEKLMRVPNDSLLLSSNRADNGECVVLYLVRRNVAMLRGAIANQGESRHDSHEDQQYEPASKTCKKLKHKLWGEFSPNNQSARILHFLSSSDKN